MGIASEALKEFQGYHIKRLPEAEPLSSGHRACQGCGEVLALRQVMKALGNDVVVCSATGCMEIITSPYPQTAWKVPWLHVAFENTSAVVSGVEAAFRVLERKGFMKPKEVVFLAYGGDGATADIGLQSLSGALERGTNFLYVCLDNEAYMNTGIQRSSSTPFGAMTTTSPPGKKSSGQSTWKKNMPAIAAAHGIPYVATASPAYPLDLMEKVKKAAAIPGPAYIHIYSPCPTGWRHETDLAIEVSRMAVLSNVFPLYEIIDGKYILSDIGKRGNAPCKAACPAGVDVPRYVSLVAQGKYQDALAVIRETNPLAAICGRVCYHPCEAACSRNKVDEPVAINSLKRFVADQELKGEAIVPRCKPLKSKKVAIVGGGPAGLSAANFLAREGYPVTIFEAMPQAGGWLRYGVPEYRLPRDVLDAEIELIKKLGVDIRTGVKLGEDLSLEDLKAQGYQAIFVGVGAQKTTLLGIPGESRDGVYAGGDFLRSLCLGQTAVLGKSVAVIGGGNVAMDAARTALRLGAAEVNVLYRRSREEMPANAEEVKEAEEEGVKFTFLVAPVEFQGNGKVEQVRCVRMELGEPDESGRRRPVPVAGSEHSIPVDSVVTAVGLGTDLSFLDKEPEAARPECNRWNTFVADPVTCASSVEGLFVGGDAVTGAATVIQAIAAGRDAAVSIDRYLRGEDLSLGRHKPVESCDAPHGEVQPSSRAVMKHTSPDERKSNFKEVQQTLTEQEAQQEAQRCLQCGTCSVCGRCESARVKDAIPVSAYLKIQRRFRHLKEAEVAKIQARIDADYAALLERCGLKQDI